MTQKNNPQWADYNELNLQKKILQSISCNILLHSEYLRFGFKLRDNSARLFGDSGIVSNDNSFLIHISKALNDDKIYATYYNGLKGTGSDELIGQYKKGEEINLKLVMEENNRIKFVVNKKLVYETIIDKSIRENLSLMAWGDRNEYRMTVKDIEVMVK